MSHPLRAGKIDLGRTIGETEIRNLPLVSRNPYNFAFLQANVTGYENNEFGVPRINANGSQMHTNYQIDGNTNTEKDRAGLRMLPISEVLVREVKVITNGFAPEFGQTTGMVYNAITQSGTNNVRGSASFRFKRNPMSSQAVLPGADRAQARHRSQRRHRHDRRPDPEGQVALLRCIRVRGSQPHHRRSGHHGDAGGCRGARHFDPGERRHPGASEGQFRVRQDRLSALARQPLSVRYFGFKNFSASNIGGGLDDHGPGDRFHRSHGLGVGAAGLHARRQHAERAARAVRTASSVPERAYRWTDRR